MDSSVLFQCVGGFFCPCLSINADGTKREADGIRYFEPDQVAERCGVDFASVCEAHGIFLGEAMTAGSQSVLSARKSLREKFAHLGDEHFEQLLAECQRRSLNPFGRHLWAKPEWDNYSQTNQLRILLTIDGFYALAYGSGVLQEIIGPQWCGKDGVWAEVWTRDELPTAARVIVKRKDREAPSIAICHMADNADLVEESQVRPIFMLGKRASGAAIRKAFAERCDGLYSEDEMQKPRAGEVRPMRIAGATFVPDVAPETSQGFRLALMDLGLNQGANREAVIEQFRERFRTLYAQNVCGWYRAVLAEVRRNPVAYGAEVEMQA